MAVCVPQRFGAQCGDTMGSDAPLDTWACDRHRFVSTCVCVGKRVAARRHQAVRVCPCPQRQAEHRGAGGCSQGSWGGRRAVTGAVPAGTVRPHMGSGYL